jgi:signal transduction histidine kinase
MRQPLAPITTGPQSLPAGDAIMRFHGRWLLLVRTVWIAVVVFVVGLFVASLPLFYDGYYQLASMPEMRAGLEGIGLTPASYAGGTTLLQVILAAVSISVALLVFWRRSDERMALFVAFFLIMYGAAPNQDHMVTLPQPWQTLAGIIFFVAFASLSPFFYLFPDGRFVPRWTRWLAPLWIVLQAAIIYAPLSPLSIWTWPFPLPLLVMFGFLSSLVFAQIYRYRRVSTQVQRQQTKWIVFGISLLIAEGFVVLATGAIFPSLRATGSLGYVVANTIFRILLPFIPVSIGIAVLRYRLWDIDPIINRTLVYAGLTACVIGIYVLIVGYLGAIFQTRGNMAISLIATGVVAVAFQPLRDRLQHTVNRLMYCDRDDPYAVIARLGRRLESSLAPDAILPTIVTTVRESLKLPYAAIVLTTDDGRWTADVSVGSRPSSIVVQAGEAVGDLVTIPLTYQHEPVGQLLLAPRSAGESFSPADRRLLDDLVRQAGVAVHAVRLTTDLQRLTADLQRSRERLITAREEERRRLRNDLHDGVGPTLSSLAQRLSIARALTLDDPPAGAAMLDELKDEVKTLIGDIRRLVYALRPPALDEFGLLGAIREHAQRIGGEQLSVTIDAPPALPPLPAAVEVAAYRIVMEALTNVVRHAHARSCTITIRLDDSYLIVEVRDDGCGLPAEYHAGVGLQSMRERAVELGGECTIKSAAGGGTLVWARLPVKA